MARFVLLLASLLSVSYGLSCYECNSTVTKVSGTIVEKKDGKECVKKTCDDGADKCVSGYAQIVYKTEQMESEVTVDYFKGCGVGNLSTCEFMVGNSAYTGGTVQENNCKIIENCTTDDCNTKTPDEINPNRPKTISCYSCIKTTVNGRANPDENAEPDQPVCSKEHKETCDLGVETCFAGNFALTNGTGTKYVVEYGKGCDGAGFTCEMIKKSLAEEDEGSVLDSCNMKSCEGVLCNTQSADDTKNIKGAAGNNFLSTALAAAAALYIFM